MIYIPTRKLGSTKHQFRQVQSSAALYADIPHRLYIRTIGGADDPLIVELASPVHSPSGLT